MYVCMYVCMYAWGPITRYLAQTLIFSLWTKYQLVIGTLLQNLFINIDNNIETI